MTRQYQSGLGVFLNTSAVRQYQSSTGAFVDSSAGGSAPVGANINLVAANVSAAPVISTVVVSIAAPVAGVVNLVAANVTAAPVIGTVAVSVTPVSGSLTTDEFTAWGNPAPLASITIPRVTVQRMSDGVQILNLANQVTNSAGKLVLNNGAIVSGVWYMVATWNADGSSRGFKAYLAP